MQENANEQIRVSKSAENSYAEQEILNQTACRGEGCWVEEVPAPALEPKLRAGPGQQRKMGPSKCHGAFVRVLGVTRRPPNAILWHWKGFAPRSERILPVF